VRGGGRWYFDQSQLDSSFRVEHDPSYTSDGVGFRVASAAQNAVVAPGQSYPLPGGSLTLSLTNALNVPSTYQWQFNDTNLPGATGPTLALSNVTTNDSGPYRVTISNELEVVTTGPALVEVLTQLLLLSQPRGANVPAGSNVTLSVTALSPLPITYQWQFDGANLNGATNSSLRLTNVQLGHSGVYRVLLTDSIGTRTSQEAVVLVLVKPVITTQPSDQTVAVGQTLHLTVAATGTQPLWYRWRRNNAPFLWPGAATLTVTNAALTNAGKWDVVITNLANAMLGGSLFSAKVNVNVVQPPSNQTVPPGSNVTLRAIVSMPQPFTNHFWWLFNGTPLLAGTNVSTSTTVFTNELSLGNFSAALAGDYTFLLANYFLVTNGSVVTTNFVGAPAAFTATLLPAGEPDTDNDGLPDAWTQLYFGHATGQAGDLSRAGDDADGDGTTNLQENLAGTDPRDPNSVLKISLPAGTGAATNAMRFHFTAVANATYSVEFSESIEAGGWSNLLNVVSLSSNRVIAITNTVPAGTRERFYRVRTPSAP
jgi:hypothetical protein